MHIVHTEASCGWGGQELRILGESAGLEQRGHRITLLCPPESRIHEEGLRRGLNVVALPIGRKNLRGAGALRRWLGAHPCDVINTHSSTDTWLAALACLTLRSPPPLVRTRHISAPVPDNAATRWLYLKATRHIVTTGEKLRRTLVEQNRYPAERITSIPTGIDTERFTPGEQAAARAALELPGDAAVIGIVATLRSWKGHRYLLQAFAQLERQDALLLIVGDGPQRKALQELAASLGIARRVRFAGNQADVLCWLHAMDVFALPSYANEGVPQSLVQAMLCGLPAVTTPVGSIPELVAHERTGLIVAPEQVEPLRAALSRLLADPDLRRRLGSAGHLHASQSYGLQTMLDRMEALFARTARGTTQ